MQGDKTHGTSKAGYLYKKSEGKMANGLFYITKIDKTIVTFYKFISYMFYLGEPNLKVLNVCYSLLILNKNRVV